MVFALNVAAHDGTVDNSRPLAQLEANSWDTAKVNEELGEAEDNEVVRLPSTSLPYTFTFQGVWEEIKTRYKFQVDSGTLKVDLRVGSGNPDNEDFWITLKRERWLWDETVSVKSGTVDNRTQTYTFRNLPDGNYYLYVTKRYDGYQMWGWGKAW